VKYAFIQQHRREFCIPRLCQVLGVARSSYYAWLEWQSRTGRREQQQADLDAQVITAFQAKKGCYGAWRLRQVLTKDGLCYNRKTIANSLKRQGLVAKAARKFKATAHSSHHLLVSPNLLEQNFMATAPNQKWAGDITYCVPGVRHQQGR